MSGFSFILQTRSRSRSYLSLNDVVTPHSFLFLPASGIGETLKGIVHTVFEEASFVTIILITFRLEGQDVESKSKPKFKSHL